MIEEVEFERVEAEPQVPAPQDGEVGGAGDAKEPELIHRACGRTVETAEKLEAKTEPIPASAVANDASQEGTALASVVEFAEELAHRASRLAVRETQLRAVHHAAEIRLALKAVAVLLVGTLALIAAFALANLAALAALSSPLPGWRAPLVLAGAWALVGLGLLLLLQARTRAAGLDLTGVLRADQVELVHGRELARDETAQEVRESFNRLTHAVSSHADALVAAAVGPIAGGAVSAGEAIIDEIAHEIEEALPGGSLISRVANLAFIPGRYFVNMARIAVGVSPQG